MKKNNSKKLLALALTSALMVLTLGAGGVVNAQGGGAGAYVDGSTTITLHNQMSSGMFFHTNLSQSVAGTTVWPSSTTYNIMETLATDPPQWSGSTGGATNSSQDDFWRVTDTAQTEEWVLKVEAEDFFYDAANVGAAKNLYEVDVDSTGVPSSTDKITGGTCASNKPCLGELRMHILDETASGATGYVLIDGTQIRVNLTRTNSAGGTSSATGCSVVGANTNYSLTGLANGDPGTKLLTTTLTTLLSFDAIAQANVNNCIKVVSEGPLPLRLTPPAGDLISKGTFKTHIILQVDRS